MSAYELRISDWSSDVCSSDLHRADLRPPHRRRQGRGAVPGRHQEPARESAPDAARDVTPSSIPGLGIRDWGFGKSRYPALPIPNPVPQIPRSEEHTSELQSLMRIPEDVFCLKKKNQQTTKLTYQHRITTK